MAANTPYIVEREGKKRMVEASSATKAVLHVVTDLGVTVKPATGRELSAWHRSNGKVEVAGEQEHPSGPQPTPAFDDAVMRQMADAARADRDPALNDRVDDAATRAVDTAALQTGNADAIAEVGPGVAAEKGKRRGTLKTGEGA